MNNCKKWQITILIVIHLVLEWDDVKFQEHTAVHPDHTKSVLLASLVSHGGLVFLLFHIHHVIYFL